MPCVDGKNVAHFPDFPFMKSFAGAGKRKCSENSFWAKDWRGNTGACRITFAER